MARFGGEKAKKKNVGNKLLIVIFLVLMVVFLWSVTYISNSNASEQRESLETAIDRCIVQCYALEGTYPPSLEYMEKNYGLTYDEDRFFVDYVSIGSNLYPDVTIIEKEEGD